LAGFERLPSLGLYRQLKARAPNATRNMVRDQAISLLRAKLRQPEGRAKWSSPRELLLQIMRTERLLTEAWQIVREHGCSDPLLESLANASESSHPAEALAAYGGRVDRLLSMGAQGNYEEACRIIGRMQGVRERLRQQREHAAYVADLMSRHKAKRNFMKLMQSGAES
jgi:hypothetical protein